MQSLKQWLLEALNTFRKHKPSEFTLEMLRELAICLEAGLVISRKQFGTVFELLTDKEIKPVTDFLKGSEVFSTLEDILVYYRESELEQVIHDLEGDVDFNSFFLPVYGDDYCHTTKNVIEKHLKSLTAD